MHQYLVKDQNDHSGYGMFSKAGRFTTEKYRNAFSQVKALFSSEKGKPAVSMEEAKSVEEEPQVIASREEVKSVVAVSQKLERKDQPFTKSMSRDKAQSVNCDKDKAPPCGYYTPKYTHILGGPKLVLDFGKQTCKTQDEVNHSIMFISPEKPKRKVKGYYNLSKMLARAGNGRDDSLVPRAELVIRDSRHQRSVDFEKQLERKSRPETSPCSNFPYDLNYKQVLRSTTIDGPDFSRVSRRKPNINKWNCINTQNHFDYDQFNGTLESSQCFPNTKKSVPSFDQMMFREKEPESSFPGFMQKSIHSRLILTTLHQKMLEQNRYMTADPTRRRPRSTSYQIARKLKTRG